jgi:PAS domain S-box-containing protein
MIPVRARPDRFVTAIGLVTAALGGAVLGGLYFGSAAIVRLVPGFTPMAPRSAINFICLGLAMMALIAGRRHLSIGLAAVAALLSSLTLIEYTTGLTFRLEPLLHVPAWPNWTRSVAPNTAACFVLLSVAVLASNRSAYFRGRSILLGLSASLASGVAFTSLVGYASSLRTFEWGGLTPMALHTACGLLLLGAGVLVLAWHDGRPDEPGPPGWLFLSGMVVAAILSVSLWQTLAADAEKQTRRAIASDLEDLKIDVDSEMYLRTAVLRRAANRWERVGEPDEKDWDFEAGLLLSDLLDFRAIVWVDPTLRIRWVAPRKGNERLRNADLSFDPRRRAAFDLARERHQAVLTRAVDLLTGGRGFQIYVPVFHGNICRGFVVGNLQAEQLFPKLIPATAIPGERIAIFDGEEQLYGRSSEDRTLASRWSERTTVNIDGSEWTLQIWPTAEQWENYRSSIPEAVLAAGFLFTALVGVAGLLSQRAWALARAADAMRRAVEKETGERRHAEQQLDQFFGVSLELLCIAGMDGYFKRLNPAWEKVLGYSLEELKAEPFFNFVHPDDREATASVVQDQAGGLVLTCFENRYRHKNGSYRWLQWTSTPVPEQALIFASARDVTEWKGAQEALQHAHEELEQRVRERTAELEGANRDLSASEQEILALNEQLKERVTELTAANQELEAFTYSVSHDLRAPLRHIDGFSKILLEDFCEKLPGEARPLLDRVRQGSNRMGRMVDELLELSRTARREPQKRVTGLRSLVDEVRAGLAGEAEHRDVEWRIGDLPFADCDPGLTKQIFVNLLSNALKFTRPRTRAIIEVGQSEVQGETAVFVRDNGVGFSMKYADRLFGAFQRLHRQEDFEGTGVGLATVQRIVHKHGGRIWAEAVLDQGATFFFTLSPPEGRTAEEILEVHDVTK